jgi:hypothetical protein
MDGLGKRDSKLKFALIDPNLDAMRSEVALHAAGDAEIAVRIANERAWCCGLRLRHGFLLMEMIPNAVGRCRSFSVGAKATSANRVSSRAAAEPGVVEAPGTSANSVHENLQNVCADRPVREG